MELLNSTANRLNGWLSNVSRGSRIALVLIAMLVMIVLINSGGFKSHGEVAELLPSTPMRQSEIQRICLAFDSAGLCEYKIENEVICVPANQRSTYLRLITEQNLLPDGLKPDQVPASRINPFMSRSQQKLIEQEDKKRTVREMVMRLPFVEQAWFEMDSQRGGTAFDAALNSAVVSVELRNGQCLNMQQIDTVRNLVRGALAGFSGDEIVVTDLNAGRAYASTNDVPNGNPHAIQQASWQSGGFDRQAWFESEIRNALKEYGGLEVEVRYRNSGTDRHDLVANRVASLPDELTTAQSSAAQSSMPVMQYGANGQATINDVTPAPDPFAPPQAVPPRARIEMARGIDQTSEHVSVSISVPQNVVEKKFGDTEPKKILGIPLEERVPEALDANFERLKKEIISKVRPILPPASFASTGSYPISVALLRAPGNSADAPVLFQLQDLMQNHWATIATLLIGALMISVVGRSGVRQPQRPVPETLSVHSEVAATTVDDESRQKRMDAKQQLSQLIEENPDKAAQVIKSWIRDAA